MSESCVNELFKKYKETGDIAYRNAIAEKYLYIAEILAKKFVGRGVAYDDLYQEASYSLLRGIERFDPSLGLKFSTFITPTITGELKNYFRDKSRMVKLPRRLSEINLEVRRFAEKYQSERGVKPSVKEIAAGLGLEEEEVVKALEIGGTLSIDSMADGENDDNRTLANLLPVGEAAFEKFETRQTLIAAMSDFTEAEKMLVKYRFVDELSQTETAKRLGVSQMFVSRTERKVLQKLKERLQDTL
ncbi:MAG: sigma-70 family RNA polymerase sigma factor [Clostridia bacterium]|nr:sigma-70 family RNA polymerase sigma factor [Clostridia bacterium]